MTAQGVAGEGGGRTVITVNGKFLVAGLDGGVHRTAAQFTGQLVRRAEAAGHRVRILVPGEVDLARSVGDLAVGDLVGGGRLEVVPSRAGGGQAWEMVALPRAAAGTLLVSFANLAPVAHPNSVVMIHDAQTLMYPRHYPVRQALGYRLMLPLIGRRARRVLTVSEFSRAALARYGVARAAKIDVVPNGTDHLLGVASRPCVLGRHGLETQGYVLALGSALAYKNLQLLFGALGREPVAGGLRLVVAGGPPPSRYRSQGLTPPAGTVFTGPVDDGELRALYEGAAVFAFPSLTEGFGLPPVEAMHCGAPVVAARAGAIPEVCGGGAAALLDPADAEGWRRALHQVADGGRRYRDDLVARGRQRAAALSWTAAGDRLWQCLQPLL